MGFLRSIFGPSKDEIWSQVAGDLGAQFHDGGFFGRDELRYRAGEWEIICDTYTVSNGNNNGSTTYTRLRAPFVNRDGLYFKIYRTGIFSGIGKWFGMQDIEIGIPTFDDGFVLKGNDPERIRRLLDDDHLRALIERQPRIALSIRDDEGFFAQNYPEGVDLLHFQCVGVIRDADTLRDLFELFATVLQRLVQIDSAYESDPGLRL